MMNYKDITIFKAVFSFLAVFLLSFQLHSQSISKGTGIRYYEGYTIATYPTATAPDETYGTEVAYFIDLNIVCKWDRINSKWVPFDNILVQSGVPAHTPSTGDPLNYLDKATGIFYYWNSASWVAATFIELTDTPSTYVGQANKMILVNPGESGLIFADTAGIGSGGIADGDKGDIIVSGSGTLWTIDNAAVDQGQLATDAVTTVKIVNDAVDQTKIADGEVTPTEIESTTVVAGSYTLASITVDEDGRLTSASNGSGLSIVEYDAGNGSIVVATNTGITFTRTSSTEGTFLIPDGVQLLSGVVHHTAAQNPGATYYLQFNFLGTRVSNNDLLDIRAPFVDVQNKFAATLSGVVNRTTPFEYSKTVNSPNLDRKVSGLSPLEITLSNYNDANAGGSNDTVIIFHF